jgi:hypothetical protein
MCKNFGVGGGVSDFEKNRKKNEMGGKKWCGGGLERPAVVGWWWRIDGRWWVGVWNGFWRMRDGGGVSGKKGNRGVRVAGGGWVWWRMAGGGVSVVGEVMGGGDFWILGRI